MNKTSTQRGDGKKRQLHVWGVVSFNSGSVDIFGKWYFACKSALLYYNSYFFDNKGSLKIIFKLFAMMYHQVCFILYPDRHTIAYFSLFIRGCENRATHMLNGFFFSSNKCFQVGYRLYFTSETGSFMFSFIQIKTIPTSYVSRTKSFLIIKININTRVFIVVSLRRRRLTIGDIRTSRRIFFGFLIWSYPICNFQSL